MERKLSKVVGTRLGSCNCDFCPNSLCPQCCCKDGESDKEP